MTLFPPRGLSSQKAGAERNKFGGSVPLDQMFAAVEDVQVEVGVVLSGQRRPFGRRAAILLAVDHQQRHRRLRRALP